MGVRLASSRAPNCFYWMQCVNARRVLYALEAGLPRKAPRGSSWSCIWFYTHLLNHKLDFGDLVECLCYGNLSSLTVYLQVEATALQMNVTLSQAHLLRKSHLGEATVSLSLWKQSYSILTGLQVECNKSLGYLRSAIIMGKFTFKEIKLCIISQISKPINMRRTFDEV